MFGGIGNARILIPIQLIIIAIINRKNAARSVALRAIIVFFALSRRPKSIGPTTKLPPRIKIK